VTAASVQRRLWVLLAVLLARGAWADPLPGTITRLRPSLVGVGTYDPLGSPRGHMLGTGFFIADGRHVATAFHLTADDPTASPAPAQLAIFVGTGQQAEVRMARRVRQDRRHDLAILRIDGKPQPALKPAAGPPPPEGTAIAIMGYPIGNSLGLHPMTNAGIVASVSPIALPQADLESLTAERIRHLKAPFPVLILDMIAYPGNSGSPVFERDGRVVGVVSGIYLRTTREGALSTPSAITYAVPSEHLVRLMEGL
jgi:S1-C subfamily serine protease